MLQTFAHSGCSGSSLPRGGLLDPAVRLRTKKTVVVGILEAVHAVSVWTFYETVVTELMRTL